MLTPPVCLSCGGPLGHLAGVFAWLADRRLQAHCREAGIDPGWYSGSGSEQSNVEYGDLLDMLGLTLVCCRTRLMTLMDFHEAMKAAPQRP